MLVSLSPTDIRMISFERRRSAVQLVTSNIIIIIIIIVRAVKRVGLSGVRCGGVRWRRGGRHGASSQAQQVPVEFMIVKVD